MSSRCCENTFWTMFTRCEAAVAWCRDFQAGLKRNLSALSEIFILEMFIHYHYFESSVHYKTLGLRLMDRIKPEKRVALNAIRMNKNLNALLWWKVCIPVCTLFCSFISETITECFGLVHLFIPELADIDSQMVKNGKLQLRKTMLALNTGHYCNLLLECRNQ